MSVSVSKREREGEVGDSTFTDSTDDVISHLHCAMQSLKSELLKTTSHALSPTAAGVVAVELTPKPDTVASVVPKINTIGQQLIGCSIEIFVNSSSSTDGSSSSTTQLTTFDIVEAEAYVLGPRHNDTFTHADPQQAVFGTFYFHRMGPGKAYKGGSFKGMDVTVGPLHDLPITNNNNTGTGGKTAKSISGHHKHENVGVGADENVEWSLPSPFYAGFLIRAVKNRQTGQLIEGPCLVVDAILAAANGAKNIIALVEDTGRAFLRCDGTEKWTTTSEGEKKDAADSTTGKMKAAVEEEQKKRREGLVGMRLVKNTNTLPTTATPSIKTGRGGDDSSLLLLYNRLSVPQHVLLAPRVGLIPRTIADLRYGGAFYRFVNICPSGTDLSKKGSAHPLINVGGEVATAADGADAVSSPSSPSSVPPPAKKGAKKDTTDKQKKSSSVADSEIVYLSKVRAGIVAALLVQRKLSELSAAHLLISSPLSSKKHNDAPPPLPSSVSVTVDSYRLLTGVTPSVFSNISAVIDKVFRQQCRLLNSNSNNSGSTDACNMVYVVGKSIVLGSPLGSPSSTTSVFDRVLGKDVKNAEVIAEVTALYGIYVADGLDLMM